LGWRVEAQWQADADRLEIAVFDAARRPLASARVSAALVRPVEKRPPLALAMAATDVGKYAASVELPMRGNWDVDILVEHGGERYAVTRRMFLR
jgi:nitrogen fixation protein FixH